MFTGFIEAVCKVKSVRKSGRSMILAIDLGNLADESKIGDSIAVNGVCLTITKFEGSVASFDISSETLTKSTLDKLSPSSQVNIERAVKATDRFGGHFVQGHIDGTAIVKAIDKQDRFAEMKFAAGSELLDYFVVKGSVAVDGISLTIAGIEKNSFSVAFIPETLNNTTLGKVKIGDIVNIETDIVVKTIKSQLDKILSQTQPLTVDRLKDLGF